MTRSAIVAIWCLPTSVFRLPVAWVSLDRRDDDPRRFWSCVVASLSRLRPDAAPPALAEAAEDSLVEWVDEVIVGIPGDFILVLDDYHLIANPTIHRSIAFLLDYAPPTLHLAIATRKDPPLPLAVLRTRDQLAEIRADELSFTLGESAALLQTITGRSLPPEAVEALQGKTEGWAASVQLAGLALRGRPDSFEAARAFSGTHRYIVDYLAEEILTQQDPDRQRFLLETAILDRLCGPLCDAVTGGTGGQATLEAFERGNLLLVPLDEDRRWYRYHHLFASFLRAQLRQTAGQQMPEREPSLHRRAALWLERNGDAAEAFEHWIAAGDTNAAARLAEVTGRDLLNRGELSRITDWLERLAAPATLERPWLGIFQAWMLTVRGEGAAALRRLAQAEARISESSGLDDLELRALRGEASALRAFAESRSGDPVQAREVAQVALAQLPETAKATRSIVHLALGFAGLLLNDVPAGESAYREALAIARESGNYHVAFPAAHNLIGISIRRGRLREAMAACQEALERGAPTGAGSLPVSAEVWADADILFQWNDLEGAATRAEKAVTLGHRWGLGEAIVRTSTSLAWICRARGHLERARSLFADVERVMIGGQFRHPQTEHRWASFRLRWWIAERQVGRAASAAMEQGLTVGAPLTFQNEAEQLGLARLLLAEGRAEEASSLLGRLSHFTAAAGRVGRQIESLILHSLALAQQHDQASALDTLREALTLAEPEGYVRLFLDEGEPLAKLLARARGTATLASGDYADRLLAALGGKGTGDTRPTAGLVEPLSRREQEILRLIARGKTYQEIAHELIVAVSTVQHHVRSLYPKLDAHSGLEAVARAGQPGLLS